MAKVERDEDTGAIYTTFLNNSDIAYTEELEPGFLVDYNKGGEIVGIEDLRWLNPES